MRFADAPPVQQAAFVWRWVSFSVRAELLATNAVETSTTVAVAKLAEKAHVSTFRHLVSISQIWALSPFDSPVAKRLQEEKPIWQVCEDLGIDRNHFIRSNTSIGKYLEYREDFHYNGGGEDSGIKFSGSMGTVHFLFAMFADVINFKKQGGDVCLWARNLLADFLRCAPKKWQLAAGDHPLQIEDGSIAANSVREWLEAHGLQKQWAHKIRGRGVRLPELDEEGVQRVSFADVWFFAVRHYGHSDATQRWAKTLVRVSAKVVDRCLHRVALEEPMACAFLPENERLFRKAAKGQDKPCLIISALLGKRQGSHLEEEATLKKVTYRKTFQYAKWAGTVSLVATATTKALEETSQRLEQCGQRTVGVRISIDDSRVSSMEVGVSHIYVCGILCCPPIQVRPDQAALLAPQDAWARFDNVVGGGAGGRRSIPNLKHRAKTVGTFYSMTNALFSVLPISSWRVFLASSWPSATEQYERVQDESSGNFYTWDRRTQASSWCMAAELSRAGTCSVWVLVFCGDEETTSQSVYFWLGGWCHARAIFWRDPSHRLSNLFCRSLRNVSGLMKHVAEHCLLFRFRRASYGIGRLMRECKETIALLLSRVEKSEALIEPFVQGVAADCGLEPDLDAVLPELRAFLRMALGPRVELRRWFAYVDSAPSLDRVWAVLLLALTVMHLFAGNDPWEAATAARRAAEQAEEDGGRRLEELPVPLRGAQDTAQPGEPGGPPEHWHHLRTHPTPPSRRAGPRRRSQDVIEIPSLLVAPHQVREHNPPADGRRRSGFSVLDVPPGATRLHGVATR